MFLILAIAINAIIALATTYFSRPQYRKEDKVRMYDPHFKVLSYYNILKKFAWGIFAFTSFSSIIIYICSSLFPGESIDDFFTGSMFGFLPLVMGIYYRKNYYTDDQEYFTCISNGKVLWSHKWTDIAKFGRRATRGYKGTSSKDCHITLNDGTVYKGLPYYLESTLREHLLVQRHK